MQTLLSAVLNTLVLRRIPPILVREWTVGSKICVFFCFFLLNKYEIHLLSVANLKEVMMVRTANNFSELQPKKLFNQKNEI